MLISDITREAGRRYGDAPALVSGGRTLSFAEFDAAGNRFANAMLARGLSPGERVAMLLPSSIEFFVASHGLARAGLVQVPLNARESVENHRWLIEDSGARAMLGDCTNADGVELRIEAEEMAAMIESGDPSDCDNGCGEGETYRLSYTGGTTGRPKAVETTPRSRTAEIACLLAGPLADFGPGDRFLHAAPVTHASGDYFLPGLIRGVCAIVLPGFDPPAFLAELERSRATHTFLVPTMLAMLLAEPGIEEADLSALRGIHWAGSPLAPSLAVRAERAFGPKLYGTYGQAEAPMTLAWLAPDEHDRRLGSAGRAYPLVEVRVVDAEDRPLPAGAEGEVVARGDLVMERYWNRPEATAKTLRNGWLHTGDIGRFDEQGYLYLLDRVGDMIISGGFNVYPREVEEALLAHPAVREAAVVGMADETWGEVVVAAVSLTEEGATEQELIDFTRDRVSGFKRPRRVVVFEELPKSGAGKIVRRVVRETLLTEADN